MDAIGTLKGPGTLFVYPVGVPAIKFEEVTVLQWPIKHKVGESAMDVNYLIFRHNERGIGWQVARTDLPYIYTEKLPS